MWCRLNAEIENDGSSCMSGIWLCLLCSIGNGPKDSLKEMFSLTCAVWMPYQCEDSCGLTLAKRLLTFHHVISSLSRQKFGLIFVLIFVFQHGSLGVLTKQGPCLWTNLIGPSKPYLIENHPMTSLKRDLLLAVTVWIRLLNNIQLCSTAGSGKSPAGTSFPLLTDQTEAFIFLFTKERRSRVQHESVAAAPFDDLQDANPSPSKQCSSLILHCAEPCTLLSILHSPIWE